MLLPSAQKSILIVEPNLKQSKPYSLLDQKIFKLTKVTNVLAANAELQKENFDLVFLSCSFSNKKLLSFLESLKQASKSKIIPLILVVDLSQPYSIVPGISWDNKIGLLSSQSAEKELTANLARLL